MFVQALSHLSLLAATPAPDRCYRTTEIGFASEAPGISIAGDVFIPAIADGPRPAILMITGNGPHTRDETLDGFPLFKSLADHFARLGFFVMRTDPRGFGGTTGPNDEEQTTTAERLVDSEAALKFLRMQPGVDPSRILIFGHSEGAMLAAELAARHPDLAAILLLSTSALPGAEVFAYQQTAGLRRRGKPDIAQAVGSEFREFAKYLASGSTDQTAFKAIALKFLRAHGPEAAKLDSSVGEKAIEGFLKSRWMRYFVGYDPRPVLARVHVPVIAIFAEKDQNVPPKFHMPALVEALTQGGNNDFQIALLPQDDHYYLEDSSGAAITEKGHPVRFSSRLRAQLDAELGKRFSLRVCQASR